MENTQNDFSVYLCKKCGVMLETGQDFCPKCGTPRGSDGKEDTATSTDQVENDSNKNQKKVLKARKKNVMIIIVILLLFIIIFAALKIKSHNSNVSIAENGKISGDSLSLAKEVYASLNKTTSYSASVISDVSAIWAWCIFDAEDEHYDDVSVNVACETDLEISEVVQAYEDLYGEETDSIYKYLLLEDYQYAVPTVVRAYYNKGYYQTTEDELNSAKEKIQSLSGEESYYEDLKNYYTAVINFRDFAFSPTGNYQNLSTTVNDYISKIDTLESNLSFDLE